jgi:hypothetical protein
LFYFDLVVDLKNKKTFIFFVTEFAQSRVGDPPDPEMVVTRNTCQARNQPADGEPSAQPQVEPPMQLPTGPLIDMEAFVQVLSRLVAPRSTEPPILPELEELSRGAGTIERLLNQKKAVPPATTSTKSLPRCRYCPSHRGPRGEPAINAVNHGDANLPRVSINIEGKEVVALIDTEATHNMIRRGAVVGQVKLLYRPAQLQTATGHSQARIEGTQELRCVP